MSSAHWFLHSLQHVNYTFAPVSHSFVLPQSYHDIYSMNSKSDYQQSIQMFFIVPLEIAAIYIITYTIIALIYCCYGKPRCIAFNLRTYNSSKPRNSDDAHLIHKKRKIKMTLTPCAKSTRVILALCVYMLIAAAIYCAILLDQTANEIGNNINASYTPYKTNIMYGNIINESLRSTALQTNAVSINMHQAQSQHIQVIQQQLSSSRHSIAQYLFLVNQLPSWNSSTEYLQISHSFSQFVIYFGMLLSVVLAVCFFMSIFGGTMVKFMSCLTFMCLLLLLVLFSVQFALSINISDACADPNNALLQIADNKTSPDMRRTLEYYLYCNPKHEYNPLFNTFNQSMHYFLSVNKSIYSLNTSTSSVIALQDSYHNTLVTMTRLHNNLQCATLYAKKKTVVDSICIDGVSQWLRVYILQFGLVLLLLIRNCCLCCGVKYQYKNKRVVMQAEYGSLSMSSSNQNTFSDYEYPAAAQAVDDRHNIMNNNNNNAKYVRYANEPRIKQALAEDLNDLDSLAVYKYNEYEYKENVNNMIKIYVRRDNGKTEYIKMNAGAHKTIHDLKQEIQIKYGYPVQTQKIVFNDRLVGCNHKFNQVGVRNGCMVYLKLEDDLNDNDDNFTVEYNGYIELNSYVPQMKAHEYGLESEDDDDGNDYWSIRIDEWCIHNKSDIIGQSNQIAIVCYQFDGKVEWKLNGMKFKSGDVVLRNITSLKYCQYETMYQHIFGIKMDSRFIGNGFKVSKYGKIKMFSAHNHKMGKIEMFWLEALVRIYREKGINRIDIEQYQKKHSRYKYDVDKFDCDLCGIDQYIFKERNVYPLLTEIK